MAVSSMARVKLSPKRYQFGAHLSLASAQAIETEIPMTDPLVPGEEIVRVRNISLLHLQFEANRPPGHLPGGQNTSEILVLLDIVLAVASRLGSVSAGKSHQLLQSLGGHSQKPLTTI
jgi:hypothetical protein